MERTRSLRRKYSLSACKRGRGAVYFGDGHAAMGDGEIAGSAIEVPMKRACNSTFEREAYGLATLRKRKRNHAAGIYRPVDDAVRSPSPSW